MKLRTLLFYVTMSFVSIHGMNLKKIVCCCFSDEEKEVITRALSFKEIIEPWDLQGWTCDLKFKSLLHWLRKNPDSEQSFDQAFECCLVKGAQEKEQHSLWPIVLYNYRLNPCLSGDDWYELLIRLVRQKNINVNNGLYQTLTVHYGDWYSPLCVLLLKADESLQYLEDKNRFTRTVSALNIFIKEKVVFNTKQFTATYTQNKEERKEKKSIFYYLNLCFLYPPCQKVSSEVLNALIECLVELGIDKEYYGSSLFYEREEFALGYELDLEKESYHQQFRKALESAILKYEVQHK